MRVRHLAIWVAAAALFIPAPLQAAIQLTPVVSGLTSPVFVGNARDNSNRLFIVEQGGIIKVLQPGSSVPTVFLDIHTKVVSGGERGLLGLAFHPNFSSNRRFFVYYTHVGDADFANGTCVIAEYKASLANPNVADPTETVILQIPHSTNANHNGGMLAFGPDGNLYIGVGDGGGSNDIPDNNAQNINRLLGKILRINVNVPPGPPFYSSPPGNPYIGVDGLDEIFAIGMRNPWRFSFDRLTGVQWVGDVGQGAREEVDKAIVAGGNYGWRVMEGTICNPAMPDPCVPANYIMPIFDYAHSGGRCSITGGYVYRGTEGTLPSETYLYADYCTGEIFAWDDVAKTQSVPLDTPVHISSFGEDEAGELYVVALEGSVSKITTPCTYSILPTSANYSSAGGNGNVSVTAGTGCTWTAVANAGWMHVTLGSPGSGNGTLGYSVDANVGGQRTGTITIATQTFTATQDAAACTYSIAPTNASYQRPGGQATVTVTAPQGCAWTAVSNVSWATILNGSANGNGNGVVTYSVSQYTGPKKTRNGTLTIAGLTFAIKQTK